MPRVYSIAVFVIALTVAVPLFGQGENRRDGNWWREITPAMKAMYITGFFDGMELGSNFSYWGLKTDNGQTDVTVSSKVIESYGDYKSKFMAHVTAGQLADGLDNFYTDYRNRSIIIFNAVWLVLNTINGKPDVEMQKMIENFRKVQ